MTKFRFNILIATVFYLLVFLFPKISEAVPIYTITDVSATPTVLQGSTTSALYTITVTNTGTTTGTGISITATPDTANIKYLSSSITLSGGATRTAISDPAVNASPMTWGNFSIPTSGSVQILVSMTVVLATTGNHNCNVTATDGAVIGTFIGVTSATENINVIDSGVTGKVFLDYNHNGILDTGETGISGVTITLVPPSFIGCTSTTTNANGEYTFSVTTSSGSSTSYYYIIENASLSASCPPLASPPSGMGGSNLLKRNLVFNFGNKDVFNFGNYPLISQHSFVDACPVDGYLSEGASNSQLSSVNLTNNLKTTIGFVAGFEYNAMIFNTSDKFLYAITSGLRPQITSELVRIDSNGVALSLGEISGLPTTSTSPSTPSVYGSGDYNPFNDRFYVHALGLDPTSWIFPTTPQSTIYAINISTRSVDPSRNITLPAPNLTADFSFNPTTAPDGVNYLYALPQAVNSSDIFKINPNTGALTTLTISGLPPSVYIASFFDPDNNLYVEDNKTTNLYKIKLNSTQTVATLAGQITNNNIPIARSDGARCPFAKLSYSFIFTTDNIKSVVPGAIITYPHRLISGTDGTVSLSITNAQGWPFTVFEDVNGNNILDAGDLAVTNFSNIGNVFAKANSEMNLLIRVQIPLNAAPNVTDTMKISATLKPTSLTLDPITIMNIDQTTVTNQATGELQLIKTAKTYLPDGTTLYDATGRTAKPNYFIDYFIDYKNISNGTLNNIKITDFVPAYTTLISSGFTAPATGTITNTPSTGITKTITWNVSASLAQTEGGQVTFRVKLN